jgi:hypothetical protein
MADADVALLRLLQEAKRADKSQTAPLGKAAAWKNLSAYEGRNPYRELGTERQSAWERVAEAEERRKEQVAKVCAKYATDSAKLRELLSLDDDVVSAKQKAAYKAELGQVYGAFGKVLEECRANAAREAAAARAAVTVGDFEDRGASFYQLSTKLEWQKQPAPNKMDWEDAKAYCASKRWRLPTKDELLSLYNKKTQGGDRFPGMNVDFYWSSSPVAGYAAAAWDVGFDGGYSNDVGVLGTARVRCVR